MRLGEGLCRPERGLDPRIPVVPEHAQTAVVLPESYAREATSDPEVHIDLANMTFMLRTV